MNVGGAENYLMNLYRTIDRSTVQFDFLTFGSDPGHYDQEIESLGGRLIKVSESPSSLGALATLRELRCAIRQGGPYRAVHAHVLHASGIALMAARAEDVPIRVAHSHSTGEVDPSIGRMIYHKTSRALLSHYSTHKVACGQLAGEYLFGRRRWKTGQVLPNAIEVERFAAVEGGVRKSLRRSWGVGPGTKVLGLVARFEPVKNHDFLLEVARDLEHRNIDFLFALVGAGSLRNAFEESVARASLSHRFMFLGHRDDVAELLASFDAIVMPSLFEGVPVSLIEAQASGLPCIVSNTISAECDLGMELVRFLPLEARHAWVNAVLTLPERRSECEAISALRAADYDIAVAADRVIELYGGFSE